MKLEDLCISFEKPLEEEKLEEFFTYIARQGSVKIITVQETRQDFIGYNPQDVEVKKPKDYFRFEVWVPWTMVPLEFYRDAKSPETEYNGLKVDQSFWWKFNDYEADMEQFWPGFKQAVDSYFSGTRQETTD